ncbi:MAG: diguanylate cyclase [Anaerolineaceae bacterium]
MLQYVLYVLFATITAAGSIALALYTYRVRKSGGVNYFFWCFVVAAAILIFDTLQLVLYLPTLKIILAKISYLLMVFIPVIWFAFALDYSGKNDLLSRRLFWIICVFPLFSSLLALTTEKHSLIWQGIAIANIGSFSILQTNGGIVYQVQAVYNLVLLLGCAYLILKIFIATPSTYRKQSIWLVLGAFLPVIANLIFTLNLIPGLQKDFTPIGYALSGMCFAVGIFKYQLFDIVPIARSTLIDKMDDGVIVLNLREQVVDINPAAQGILGLSRRHIIGKDIGDFFASWPGYFNCPEGEAYLRSEVEQYRNGTLKYYEVRTVELTHKQNHVVGLLLTMHDITERKVLLEKVRKLATLDPLTGLFNRRHFFSMATKEVARTLEENLPCSLVLLDMDYFKQVNDTYGHLVGDMVIQKVTNTIRNSLRTLDILGRFGGDEFVLLLPETDLEQATQATERLRKLAESTMIRTDQGEIHVTLSMGVATCTGLQPCSLDQLLEQADKALYRSKAAGRNKVHVWQMESVDAMTL